MFVDQKGAEAYKTIYDKVKEDYDYALKQFNFELIVYDETEYFRDAGEEGFDYPYSNQKNNLNYYAPTLNNSRAYMDFIYLKRSIVCLEEFYMNQMNLPN